MDTEKLINSITKALAYTENGGKPDPSNSKAGKTGEMKSIFQFTPATWKNYSNEVFGKPGAPLTPDSETYVVQQKVSKWVDEGLKQGKTPEQVIKEVASRWNAGDGEPESYNGTFSDGSPSSGINKKYGVKFDVPAYADKVSKYAEGFLKENNSHESQGTQQSAPTDELTTQRQQLLSKLGGIIQQAKNNTRPQQIQPTQPQNGLMGGMINPT